MSGTTLLTPHQTADRLGIARQTLARWRCEGRGPRFTKLSSTRVMYDAVDVEQYIANLPRRRSTSDTMGAAQ